MSYNRQKDFRARSALRWLRAKLRQDANFISVLKQIIDEIPGEIPDNMLFDQLKPRISSPWPPSLGSRPSVSPDSVDMLFYPWVRKKLKSWQADYFNESLNKLDRDKGRDKIERVFRRLLFKGSGPPPALSHEKVREVFNERNKIKKLCRKIIQDSAQADIGQKALTAYRKEQIENRFEWCRNLDKDKNVQLEKAASTTRAEQMRAAVLAIKFDCDPRAIKEIIRKGEEGFREFQRQSKSNPRIVDATITGGGNHKKVRTS
jgi:hypothetical protein